MYENEPEFETEPKPAENISADGLEKISENPLDFDIPETVCCDYRQPYKRARRLLYNDKDYERAYKALVTEVSMGTYQLCLIWVRCIRIIYTLIRIAKRRSIYLSMRFGDIFS